MWSETVACHGQAGPARLGECSQRMGAVAPQPIRAGVGIVAHVKSYATAETSSFGAGAVNPVLQCTSASCLLLQGYPEGAQLLTGSIGLDVDQLIKMGVISWTDTLAPVSGTGNNSNDRDSYEQVCRRLQAGYRVLHPVLSAAFLHQRQQCTCASQVGQAATSRALCGVMCL